jgi:hypothetical protein
VIGDVESDGDEPRGGSFRIGGDLSDLWDDEEGYGPSTVIQWREDRTAAGTTSGSPTRRRKAASKTPRPEKPAQHNQ